MAQKVTTPIILGVFRFVETRKVDGPRLSDPRAAVNSVTCASGLHHGAGINSTACADMATLPLPAAVAL
jgi:hypothetical protein